MGVSADVNQEFKILYNLKGESGWGGEGRGGEWADLNRVLKISYNLKNINLKKKNGRRGGGGRSMSRGGFERSIEYIVQFKSIGGGVGWGGGGSGRGRGGCDPGIRDIVKFKNKTVLRGRWRIKSIKNKTGGKSVRGGGRV